MLDPDREKSLKSPVGVLRLINDACADETGAGFTVRLWLDGGHELEMSLEIPHGGYTIQHTCLYGSRLTANGYEDGSIAIPLHRIVALEIVW